MNELAIGLSIRLDLANGTRFGPGKAKLLEAIANQGSVSGAARLLGMSYPRALRLVDEMNTQFLIPLVETFQGGASRGGATLTQTGIAVQELYRDITTDAQTASAEKLSKLDALCSSKP